MLARIDVVTVPTACSIRSTCWTRVMHSLHQGLVASMVYQVLLHVQDAVGAAPTCALANLVRDVVEDSPILFAVSDGLLKIFLCGFLFSIILGRVHEILIIPQVDVTGIDGSIFTHKICRHWVRQ